MTRLAEVVAAADPALASHAVSEPGPGRFDDMEGVRGFVLEAVYEGYLLHYGRPRLFSPEDQDAALLLGDYLYAHGLVRIEEVGTVEAVSDLAELIALCAYLRAEDIAGDGPVGAATAATLGRGELDEGRSSLRLDNDPSPLERLARARAGDAAVDSSLATHRGRLR